MSAFMTEDIELVFKSLLQCPAIDRQSCICVAAHGQQVASLNCLPILPYLYYIMLSICLFICLSVS